MGIIVKAVEKKIAYLTKDGKDHYMFVMQPMMYGKLDLEKVIEQAAINANISTAVMQVAYTALGKVISTWATEGHSVPIPGIGTMRFGIRADAVEKVDEVSTKLIKQRRVLFQPNSEIKKILADTSINIICYDRNGNLVKRVNSQDKDDIENPDDSKNPTEDDNNPGSGSTTPTPDGSDNEVGDGGVE